MQFPNSQNQRPAGKGGTGKESSRRGRPFSRRRFIAVFLLPSQVSSMATTTTTFPHCNHPLLYNRSPRLHRRPLSISSFGRHDFDRFAQRIVSREVWRDAWLGANDRFELFLFEARKTAERIDLRYSVSHRVRGAARSAADRALAIDREFEIARRWRTFTLDFSRNCPRYRKELNDFLQTPLGRGFATIFFLWFAFSGWLFRCLIFATWILPFVGPLLIGTVANNLVIKGSCPACKRQFVGYKNQVVRCTGCGNIVWQPKGDFFSGGGFPRSERGNTSKKSEPDIIDVEFEEK